MGPLSVLGPAGSLGDLISATGKLARLLHKLAKRVRTAGKDIDQFACRLSTFSFASDRACACILQHYSGGTELVTLSIVEERDFLRDAKASARYIMDNVKKIKPRMRSMESSSIIDLSLISKLKWAIRKSEVHDLTFKMNALESSLTLLMITVVYEVQIKQKAAPEALAITMRQIKNFMKEAKTIVSKLDGLAGAQSDSAQASQRFNNLLKNVGYTADGQLEAADREREASGLFQRGTWVPINPASPIPREDIRPRRPRRRTPSQETRPRRATPPQERGTSAPPSPMPPNERISINVTPRNQGKGKGRQSDRGPPEASSSSRGVQEPVGSNSLDSHNAGDTVSSGNDRSRQPPGSHFPQGAELKYRIAPRASDTYEEVNGQISKGMRRNSKSSRRTITARVYPKFSMNAISRDFAKRLGLEVTALSDDFFVELLSDIGSTRVRVNDTVGEVRFEWHTPTHILPVLCTVFEQEIVPGVPLALGKPYAQQVETSRGVVRGEGSRAGAVS